ncbi:MAG TPA: hypothetical protein VNC78_00830 [Actinomycetota bacterium]|nr:hypothetical protein [Actinomycetota bacterium]
MGKDRNEDPKAGLLKALGATLAGVIATRIAAYIVTTGWRLVTREDPPQVDSAATPMKKAAWIGLISAATGAARQTARDKVKPPGTGP